MARLTVSMQLISRNPSFSIIYSLPLNSLQSFLLSRNKHGHFFSIYSILSSVLSSTPLYSISKLLLPPIFNSFFAYLFIFSIIGRPASSKALLEYNSSITSFTSSNLDSSEPSITNTTPLHS